MLKSMPKGLNNFEFALTKQFFANMENSEVRDADLAVNLRVDNAGEYYDFDFKVSGTLTIICDRCLDDLVIPVETDYHLVVKYGEEYNDESDEVLEIPESDSYINVAYMLYDTAMLAIPIKHVHPAGKCNKVMSQILRQHRVDDDEGLIEGLEDFGDEMADSQAAIDPRWEQLRNFNENNN